MRYWILKAKTKGDDAYNYARKLKPGHADNWVRVTEEGHFRDPSPGCLSPKPKVR